MMILLLIGAGTFATGMYTLFPVILFYLGQRRDLYFHPENTWMQVARWGILQVLGSVTLMVLALLTGFDSSAFVFTVAILVISLWWFVSTPLLTRFPPFWVRDFEVNRSPQEIEAVRQNGAALLQTYPQAFRLVLQNPEGWDTWLLTVTSLIPMASLEVYERRAHQAIEHNLYPIAIVAANNIIKYRPDKALGYELRALAYFKDHKYERALADLNVVLHKQPHNAEPYYQRARIHMILEQPHLAVDDLNRALEIMPNEERFQKLKETAQKVVEGKLDF